MNRIQSEQQKRNAQTSGAWELFEPHRDRVTNLLAHAARQHRGRLCVLGAGNCNDLDLAPLCADYDEIHLVDLDSDALRRGVARQQIGDADCLRLHGGVDLCGVAELLNACSPSAPADDNTVDTIAQQAVAAACWQPDQPFDTAASVGLLSQLIDAVVLSIGEDHPRFFDIVEAVRARHLRLLLELTRPGGAAVLVTDVVSSDTLSDLPYIADDNLPDAVGRAIEQRNFFTGANPFVLKRLFETDRQIAPLADKVDISLPWRWDLGPRMYAVCALVVRRSSRSRPPDGT